MRHLTQEQLALKVGVSQGLIAQLESPNITRKKSPRLDLLVKISNALGVCCNDILHFNCSENNCIIYETCNKRQYLEGNDDDFFDDNLIYYL